MRTPYFLCLLLSFFTFVIIARDHEPKKETILSRKQPTNTSLEAFFKKLPYALGIRIASMAERNDLVSLTLTQTLWQENHSNIEATWMWSWNEIKTITTQIIPLKQALVMTHPTNVKPTIEPYKARTKQIHVTYFYEQLKKQKQQENL